MSLILWCDTILKQSISIFVVEVFKTKVNNTQPAILNNILIYYYFKINTISLKGKESPISAFANIANDKQTAPLIPPWTNNANSLILQPYPYVNIYFLKMKNVKNLHIYIPI